MVSQDSVPLPSSPGESKADPGESYGSHLPDLQNLLWAGIFLSKVWSDVKEPALFYFGLLVCFKH